MNNLLIQPREWLFDQLALGSKTSPNQLAQWEICGGGYGIHWEALDEDLSTEGMLRRHSAG